MSVRRFVMRVSASDPKHNCGILTTTGESDPVKFKQSGRWHWPGPSPQNAWIGVQKYPDSEPHMPNVIFVGFGVLSINSVMKRGYCVYALLRHANPELFLDLGYALLVSAYYSITHRNNALAPKLEFHPKLLSFSSSLESGMKSLLASLVEEEFGSAFIGFSFSLCLYGTTLAQTIFYVRSFSSDNKATKWLVCFLSIVDTFHVYLLAQTVWNVFVYGPSVGLIVLTIPWQISTSFLLSYLVMSVVQCFFGLRVWNISGKNKFITSVIGITSAAQLGAGLGFSAHLITVQKLTLVFDLNGSLYARIQLICSMTCDLTISASLVYYFYAFRVNMDRSKDILQSLIVLSVNMGVLLCLGTAITLILFQVKSGTFVSLGPHFILSKLYVNSLLATLNSRKHFRALANRTISFSLPTISTAIHTHDSDV